MVSGYNRHATIQNSDFSYIGGNAIAAWGYTNETEGAGHPQAGIDGTDGMFVFALDISSHLQETTHVTPLLPPIPPVKSAFTWVIAYCDCVAHGIWCRKSKAPSTSRPRQPNPTLLATYSSTVIILNHRVCSLRQDHAPVSMPTMVSEEVILSCTSKSEEVIVADIAPKPRVLHLQGIG